MLVGMLSMTISGCVPTLFEKVPTPRRMGVLSPVLGLMSNRKPATWPSSELSRSLCICWVSFLLSTNPNEPVALVRLMVW